VLASVSASRQALADDLDGIRARGVLRIGTSGDYAPFSSARGKGFVGLDVELGQRLARDLRLKVAFVRFAWPELTQALKAGLFDVALSGITLRGDRAVSGRFSRPYAVSSALALIRRDDAARFAVPASLNRAGVRLVVNAGGHLEKVTRQLFPEADVSLTTDNTKLLSPLLAKTADAAISDSAEAPILAGREWSSLSSLGPLTHDRKGIWVSTNAEKLVDVLDRWLRERERDGFLSKLRGRYLGPLAGSEVPLNVEAVLADIQLRCELMPLVGAYKVAHGLPIEDEAQEARVLARIDTAARAAGLESEGVEKLYRSLMKSAKEIERAKAPAASESSATLDELRLAIRSIDNQLLAELREALQDRTSIDWTARVQGGIAIDGLSPARTAEISAALSGLGLTR
jgi:cyclohexadienyl dehydratase